MHQFRFKVKIDNAWQLSNIIKPKFNYGVKHLHNNQIKGFGISMHYWDVASKLAVEILYWDSNRTVEPIGWMNISDNNVFIYKRILDGENNPF